MIEGSGSRTKGSGSKNMNPNTDIYLMKISMLNIIFNPPPPLGEGHGRGDIYKIIFIALPPPPRLSLDDMWQGVGVFLYSKKYMIFSQYSIVKGLKNYGN